MPGVGFLQVLVTLVSARRDLPLLGEISARNVLQIYQSTSNDSRTRASILISVDRIGISYLLSLSAN
jgi:hypothetical protein